MPTLVEVVLPEMGESVAEGTITAWHKRVGETVQAGEALVDVTTDKVDVEVPASAAGTVTKILAAEGATVKVGAPLAEIDTGGAGTSVPADSSRGAGASAPAETAGAKAPALQQEIAGSKDPAPQSAPDVVFRASEASSEKDSGAKAQAQQVHASPVARRIARERGVDLRGIQGSRPGGVIVPDDVLGAPSQPASVAPADGARTIPLKGPAASLAGHMEASLSIPTATSFRTISVDTLDVRRRDLNAALKTAGRAEKVSYTHLVGFAIAQATHQVPVMTWSFRRAPSGPERLEQGVNLGLAVDMQRKDGSRFLVVPVIRDADKLSFSEFHKIYEVLVAKSRSNSLAPAELAGATITLTNPGGIGTVASVPRLMPGQGTIVATGAIGYPPGLASVPQSTLLAMGVAKVMTLTSTYDHRVIMGAQSGEFLARVEALLNGADGFYDAVFASLGLPGPSAAPKLETRAPGTETAPAGAVPAEMLRAATAGSALVARYRTHGHTAAMLDPLGEPPAGDPALDPTALGLTPTIMASIPAAALRIFLPGNTLAELLPRLRETYCSTIAYQMEHISNHEQRNWMREQIESGAHRRPLTREESLKLLDHLSSVEVFERYLRRSFLGQKTFSIEGLDAMIPMLEETLDLLGAENVGEVDIGMAHRGRLAVITHVVGRPFEEALQEFELAEKRGQTDMAGDVTGDVKYHQGAEGVRQTPIGKNVRVVLANNPSHLEAVNSVVEGRTRAAQTDRSRNVIALDPMRAVAVLIHGDAAFSAQGSVAEVLNLQGLAGYSTGGTIHMIANNQIGFTTTPGEGRSTRYASDLAKGFDVPIIHVNADDVEACIAAVRLCVAFRRRFKRDILVDVVGYRRFGHNETDEPAYTQPIMYERIKNHPTVREIFARRLIERGIISQDEAGQLLENAQRRIAGAHENVKRRLTSGAPAEPKTSAPEATDGQLVDTRVPASALTKLNEQLLAVPAGFTVHPKLERQFERRHAAFTADGEIDWGLGEALAFATLLLDAKPVRLTGQDTERGTFSHRHAVLHDPKTGASYTPLQNLPEARASFEVYNSPLSEFACVGFEYGYSESAPEALVLWEAQFGDFFNGAQIIIDQFISAGEAKWGSTARLTLLLPHGYEGAGPEHSSARLERFLQLAAEDNLRIANCTTPAQYFHLLRDQALSAAARPLVIMTPKSLLRMKAAFSSIADLSERGFSPVIDDASVTDRARVERLILCSGKIYYDLIGDPMRAAAADLAIARVELLEPFPLERVLELVASYPNLRTVAWVQEEPKNMGARAFVSRRIRERLTPKGIAFGYVGRPDRASPSEGYPGPHAVEQARIVHDALSLPIYKETR